MTLNKVKIILRASLAAAALTVLSAFPVFAAGSISVTADKETASDDTGSEAAKEAEAVEKAEAEEVGGDASQSSDMTEYKDANGWSRSSRDICRI